MATEAKTRAMLTILLATCETTLNTLKAAHDPVDSALIADLERMVDRTRRELAALSELA